MTTRKTSAVSRARGRRSRVATTVAVAVVLLVAVVVFGGVYLLGGASSALGATTPIPPRVAGAHYPTAVVGGTVVAGSPAAPRTLDVYEDALCPLCGQFEAVDGPQVTDALDAGRLQVRYHLVNLLDERSRPPGYSTAAGNAIICAAENGVFADVHASLFAAQPEEGAAGYTVEQLAHLGPAVHAAAGYDTCVRAGRHSSDVASNYRVATADPALQQSGSNGSTGFGTPTLVSGGRLLRAGSPELATFLAG